MGKPKPSPAKPGKDITPVSLDQRIACLFDQLFHGKQLRSIPGVGMEKNLIASYLAEDISDDGIYKMPIRKAVAMSFAANYLQQPEKLERFNQTPPFGRSGKELEADELAIYCASMMELPHDKSFRKNGNKSRKSSRFFDPDTSTIMASAVYREAICNKSLVHHITDATDLRDLQALMFLDFAFNTTRKDYIQQILKSGDCNESKALQIVHQVRDRINLSGMRRKYQKLNGEIEDMKNRLGLNIEFYPSMHKKNKRPKTRRQQDARTVPPAELPEPEVSIVTDEEARRYHSHVPATSLVPENSPAAPAEPEEPPALPPPSGIRPPITETYHTARHSTIAPCIDDTRPTFFECFREMYRKMSPRRRKKFIKKAFSYEKYDELTEGVKYVTPESSEDPITLEFKQQMRKCYDNHFRKEALKREAKPMAIIAAALLGIGALVWGYTASRDDPQQAEQGRAAVVSAPRQQYHEVLTYQCRNEPFWRVSRRVSGTGNNALEIRRFNKQHNPEFRNTKRCKGEVLIPPSVVKQTRWLNRYRCPAGSYNTKRCYKRHR